MGRFTSGKSILGASSGQVFSFEPVDFEPKHEHNGNVDDFFVDLGSVSMTCFSDNFTVELFSLNDDVSIFGDFDMATAGFKDGN